MRKDTLPPAKQDLRGLLGQEHRDLDRLFQDLLMAFRTGDREEVGSLWNEFESGLMEHMTFEEERILPEFAKVAPAEAAALAREHVLLRRSLSELGIGVDLHCTNAAAVERFVAVLRNHARREDALLYRWAQANLSEKERGRHLDRTS